MFYEYVKQYTHRCTCNLMPPYISASIAMPSKPTVLLPVSCVAHASTTSLTVKVTSPLPPLPMSEVRLSNAMAALSRHRIIELLVMLHPHVCDLTSTNTATNTICMNSRPVTATLSNVFPKIHIIFIAGLLATC